MANQDFRVKNGLQVGLGASVVGIVTAESFSGSAVGLTNVPSASLTGTISSERLSGTYDIDILGTVSGDSINIETATVTEQLNVGAGDTGVFATATDGTLSVSGVSTFKDTTDNTLGDATTGAVQIRGGLGISSNVTVGGGLSVTGDSYFVGMVTFASGTDGSISIGDGAGDNVVINAQIDSNLIPDDDDTYDLGSSTQEWRDLYIDGTANIDSLAADTAAIGDLTDNQVVVAGTSGELEGDANLTYDGTELIVGTATTGSVVRTDGTLNVSGISTFQDRVIFDSTNSIQIPVGTDAEKDAVGTAVTGQIRYNTTNSQFEGFGPGNDWGSLGGVKDVDGDTYVKPESSPGSDEDALTFFTAGTERAVIDSNGKVGIGTTNPTKALDVVGYGTSNGIRVGDTHFFAFDDGGSANKGSPTFQNLNPNGNTILRVLPNGTGKSQFEFFATDYFANAGIGTTTWNNLRIFANNNQGEIRIDTSAATEAGVAKSISIETNVSPGGETRPNQYQLYLDINGNIGLGTNTPSSTLDVDGTLNVSGISTFQNNVTFVGAFQTDSDLTWDKSNSRLSFEDEAQLSFGDNFDLFIYHTNGGTSLPAITTPGTYILAQHHDLIISAGNSRSVRMSNSGSGTLALFDDIDDNVELYYQGGSGSDNGKKLETIGYGISVYGGINASGVSTFQDRVIFDSTNSIQIPVGTSTERDAVGTAVTGQIRYNTTLSSFEGYGPGGEWGTLGGVKDIDQDTYITAQKDLAVDDDALRFYTNGTEQVSIDSTGKVGIGSTQPTSTLDLDGTLNVSGVSTFQDDVNIGTGTTTAFFDVSAGKVGIRTDSLYGKISFPTSTSFISEAIISAGNDIVDYGLYVVDSGTQNYVRQFTINNYSISVGATKTFRISNADGINSSPSNTGGMLDNQVAFVVNPNTSTELRYNYDKKLETTGYGVTVAGGAYVSGISTFQNSIRVDNIKSTSTNTDITVQTADYFDIWDLNGSKRAFGLSIGGSVDLNYNGNSRLQTTADGIKVLNGTSETAVISGPQNIILDPSPDDVVAIVEGDISAAGVSTITGITTTNIAVGNLIQEVDGVISAGTTVTSVGISSLTISNVSLDSATNQEFTFTNQTPTGIVRIKGDLYVDGTTTEINSTTLTVDDLNVVVASGATNGLTADGAGLTVDGANAYLKYNYNSGTNETWELNKDVGIGTDNARATLDVNGDVLLPNGSYTLNFGPSISDPDLTIGHYGQFPTSGYLANFSGHFDYISAEHFFKDETDTNTFMSLSDTESALYVANTKKLSVSSSGISITDDVNIGTAATVAFFDISSGKVGIGSTQPTSTLDVNGTLNVSGVSTFQDNVSIAGTTTKLYLDADTSGVGLALRPKIKIDTPTVGRYFDTFVLDAPSVQYVRHLARDLDYNISVSNDRTFLISGGASFTTALNTPGVLDADIAFKVIPESSTELRYNKVKKLETTGYGVSITDGLNVSGISTFTSLINADGGIDADTLKVIDLTDNRVVIAGTGGELEDDSNFTFDGNQLVVGANLDVSGVSTFQGNVNLGDDDKLRLGDGNDLEIYHSSSSTANFIDSNVSGAVGLYIRTTVGNIEFKLKNKGDDALKLIEDGAVELYYDNSKKLETTGYGVTVTGGLNVSGIITASTFVSNVSTGTSPLTVTSTTLVSNLNADKLDGQEGSYYLNYSNFTNTPPDIRWFGTAVGIWTSSSVGIGTTNPTSTLTVDGTLNVSGIATAQKFVGDGSELTNLPPAGSDLVTYASASNIANSAESISGISTYIQLDSLLSSQTSGAARPWFFGRNNAMSADASTLIVGSYEGSLNGIFDNIGVVHVFDREGNSYREVGILTAGAYADDGDDFGYSVACSTDGRRIVVGAYSDEPLGSTGGGLVHIFDRQGDTFTRVGVLTGSYASQSGDSFGYEVDCSGDGNVIVVGAKDDETGASASTGVVYVFDRNGNDFTEVGIITSSSNAASDVLGHSVSISEDGNTIVASAIGDNNGAVYVFDRTGTNTFNEVGILTGGTYPEFGNRVKISSNGKTIVVGCPNAEVDEAVAATGLVQIFDRNPDNTFTRVGVLTGSYASQTSDYFGDYIDVSADGNTIAVGAFFDELSGTGDGGLGYIFTRQGDTFEEVSTFIRGKVPTLSADGKTVAFGDPNYESGGSGAGRVVIYEQQRQTYLHSTSTGNIGIGVTNPTAKLDVNGTLNVSGVSTFITSDTVNQPWPTSSGDGTAIRIKATTLSSYDSTGNGSVSTTDISRHLQGRFPANVSIANTLGTAGINFSDGDIQREQAGFTQYSGSFALFTRNSTYDYSDNYIWASPYYGVQVGYSTLGGNTSGFVINKTSNDGNGNITQILRIDAGSDDLIFSGQNVGIGSDNPTAKLDVNGSIAIKNHSIVSITTSHTASAGTPFTIDTFATSENDLAEYTIHVGYGNTIQAQKVLVMHDGTTAYSQEYAVMSQPSKIVSIEASIFGSNVLLRATPESGVSGITTYKIVRGGLV